MDELTVVGEFLSEERPAPARTIAEARRRLTDETIKRRPRLYRRDKPSPRIAVIAVATAAVVTVAAGVHYAWTTRPLYHPEPLAGQTGPASRFLLAAADAKARHVTEGRLWYVHTVNERAGVVHSEHEPGVRYTLELVQGHYLIAAKTEDGLGKNWSAESWADREEQLHVRPASAADRTAWDHDKRPPGVTPVGPTDDEDPDEPRRGPTRSEGAVLDFGVTQARRLPSDPAKLRAWLLNYATKFDHKRLRYPDLYLFTNASSLLIDEPVPDQVRIATYRVLASLKGVRIVTATDASGRTGQAVTMRETTRENGTIDWQLFIDPSTGQLTASQAVVVRPGTENSELRPGTRQFSEVVKQAEWTNAPADQLRPAWVRANEPRNP
ncbi:CU044_5270 family protein [Actinomadura sp. DC4]|uniref:CU044_5270 family protein n=1 Tax=Actinomadura sp. DC4 TaxID=3055069 RepID=UPI0025B02856|nr:CU044_5270 family protein [Actinomadura sp. DC4]MDN3354165.1 CU044_5270 family protein [Actinomadura sp. DC4]